MNVDETIFPSGYVFDKPSRTVGSFMEKTLWPCANAQVFISMMLLKTKTLKEATRASMSTTTDLHAVHSVCESIFDLAKDKPICNSQAVGVSHHIIDCTEYDISAHGLKVIPTKSHHYVLPTSHPFRSGVRSGAQ